MIVAPEGEPDLLLSSHYACAACGLSFDPPSPQLFSFNSPQGMCPAATAWASATTSTPTCSCPTRRSRSGTGRSSRSARSRRSASGGGTSSKGVAANLEADHDGPPKGAMLKGPWQDLDPKWQRRLAPRHRRPRDRPPLAEPGQALVARREVGGRRQRADGQVQGADRRARPARSSNRTCGA